MKPVGLSAPHAGASAGPVCRLLLIAALFVASAGVLVPAAAASGPAPDPATAGHHLIIENAGQFPAEVRFTLEQGNQRIWLTNDALWLMAPDARPAKRGGLAAAVASRRAGADRRPGSGTALRFRFAGADLSRAEPFGPLATHVSYFIGNDPAAWRVNVPAWSGVRYRDIYPGINLLVGGDAGGLMPWRLEARAGANLDAVRLQVDGAEATACEAGKLTFELGGRTVSVDAPGWTVDGGPATAAGVAAEGANAFAVAPAADGAAAPAAVAASALVYSRVLGGATGDGGGGIAVDGSGNAYITGVTSSSSFPGVAGHYDSTYNSGTDAFVAKLNANATSILYATYIGGSGEDAGVGIAVSDGVAYVTGETASANFPGGGTAGGKDAFVVALDAAGNNLVYSRTLGGTRDDKGAGIALSGSDAYIVGTAGSGDLAGTGCGAIEQGSSDLLVARLNPAGAPVFVKCFGGSNVDNGYAVAVANQVAFVTGETWSEDIVFPQPPLAGESDVLVAAFGSDGSMRAVTFFGGSRADQGAGIAASVNTSGNGSLWIAGASNSNNFKLAAARDAGRWDNDAVVAQVQVATTTKLQLTQTFAEYLSGSGEDAAQGIAADTEQALYVAGATASTDFPVTSGAYDTDNANGTSEAFVARLDLNLPAGNHVTYATYLGGAGEDAASRVAADSAGHAFITGSTNGQGFPVTTGPAPVNDDQAFVARLSMGNSIAAPAVTISAAGADVVLTWGAAPGAARYEAFRSALPYFAAGDAGSTLLPGAIVSPYHDPGVLGQVGAYFYVVRAVSAAPEQAGPDSNQTGKFTFGLVKGN